MPRTLRLALREYMAAVKTKGFIIGLVIMPVLMGGSGLAMILLKDQVDTTDKRVAVLDRSGVVAPNCPSRLAPQAHTAPSDRNPTDRPTPALISGSTVPRAVAGIAIMPTRRITHKRAHHD